MLLLLMAQFVANLIVLSQALPLQWNIATTAAKLTHPLLLPKSRALPLVLTLFAWLEMILILHPTQLKVLLLTVQTN